MAFLNAVRGQRVHKHELFFQVASSIFFALSFGDFLSGPDGSCHSSEQHPKDRTSGKKKKNAAGALVVRATRFARIDSRESFAIEIPIFRAHQADSPESLEFSDSRESHH